MKGKNILVTGATGYLGKQMCIGLGKSGANVWVNGRDELKVEFLVNELKTKGLSAEPATFDIQKNQSCIAFFEKNKRRELHGLVNNAYFGKSGSIEFSTGEQYQKSYEISVVSVHNLIKLALPSLRLSCNVNSASVVNIASMYGMVSPDIRLYESPEYANSPFYGAAKAALIQWTRYAACEYGKENIRFNAISPGPFPSTDIQEKAPDFIKRLESKTPMGRIGQAKEIIGPLVFLLSNESSYVNGANLVVDGGWTCW